MSSFDRMVINMSHAERMCLYDKLSASISSEEQSIAPPSESKEDYVNQDLQTKLKSESSFFRFILFFRSLFSGIDVSNLYNNMLVNRIAKKIEKTNSELLIYKKGMVGSFFYEQLRILKNASDFFKPAIDLYEEEPGRFYVFLSSLVIPDYYEHMEREIDPFLLGDDKEPKSETRLSLLRRMEEVFQMLTSAQRNTLYKSVINIDWLRQFVRLPFERMLARFLPVVGGGYAAQLELISNDLSQFCRILCNAKNLTTEVLQALCLFSTQSQLDQPQIDVETVVAEYVTRSLSQISIIKKFLKAIPLQQLARVAFKSANWTPSQPEGSEDWFVKYKTEWRKLFDERWNSWLKAKNRQIVEKKVFAMLKTTKLPELPFQPWDNGWSNLKFPRTEAMGFLYGFFTTLFEDINKLLKILVVDGNFKQRENRIELTESFNGFSRLAGDVDSFAHSLSPEGKIGQFFANVDEKDDRSIKAHARLESALQSAYSEASVLSMRFKQISESIVNVLSGVLSETKIGKYDTINNIAAIGGHLNQQYRQQLAEVRDTLNDALNCLKELEVVDI